MVRCGPLHTMWYEDDTPRFYATIRAVIHTMAYCCCMVPLPTFPAYGYQPADPAAPPVVSILTPYTYSGVPLLETARTLLRQSLQQWEWIIVNDSSTDPLAQRVLLPLRHADARIRVVDQERSTWSTDWNAAAALARAPYLLVLDPSAALDPTALEKLAWTLVSYADAALAVAAIAPPGMGTPAGLAPDPPTYLPLILIRRTHFATIGGFAAADSPAVATWEYRLRSAAQGDREQHVPEPLGWAHCAPAPAPRLDEHLRARYAAVVRARPPQPTSSISFFERRPLIATGMPFANRLSRPDAQRRILMFLPIMATGGAERFALHVIRGLIARGDRVTVVLTRDDVRHTWYEELQRLTPDVFLLPQLIRADDFPRFLHYLIESRGITLTYNALSILGYSLLPYLRAHCPQVAHVDYTYLVQPQGHGGLPRYSLDYSGLIDLHIVTSDDVRTWLIAQGAAPERIAVCSVNVDHEQFRPDATIRGRIRAELGIDAATPIILFAARLAAEKRVYLLAQILTRLAATGTPFVAIVAGDGEDMPLLRYTVWRNRLQRQLRLLGAVPHQRLRELMLAADICLLPSEREGVALILYEAMACGVVPVASDVGGQHELVTPECGFLIPIAPHEEDQYLEILQRLCSDRALRERMGACGRQRIEQHFRIDQMHERMHTLLEDACHLHISTPRAPVAPEIAHPETALALELFQLEHRLRHFAPIRLLIRLRWSSVGYWISRSGVVGRLVALARQIRGWLPQSGR